LGDHDKAVNYIERSDKLAGDLLPSMQHEEILHNLVTRVEILSKLKQENRLLEAIDLGQKAYALSQKLFGKVNVVTT
jgi:hypothetical protein